MLLLHCLSFNSLIVNNPRDDISFTAGKKYYTAGDGLEVNCIVTAYQLSPAITTEVTINLQHNTKIKSSTFYSKVEGSQEFYLGISFSRVKLSNAGSYTCFYFLSNNNSFVRPSNIKTTVTSITVKSEFYCKNYVIL